MLLKNLRINYPQGTCISEGYKGTLIAHCNGDNYSYAYVKLKEDKPGCKKAEYVEMIYTKYQPSNTLPTHEYIIPNQIYKEIKEPEIYACVTNEAKHNLTTSQKEILRWILRPEILGSNICNG